MSSSSSPQNSNNGGQSDKGPLSSLNLNFLKSLNDKKTTRDGNPPKRRGPKPDSKPALTRRQELNRQAQRTHRERKELYIKALEDEVLRLKEIYSNVSQDKDKLAEENRQLKTLLQQNGISLGSAGAGIDDVASGLSPGYTSSGSISGSYAPGSSNTAYTPPHSTSISSPNSMSVSSRGPPQGRSVSQPGQSRVDYEQAGIDFVLTYENPDDPSKALERPCMDHMPWLIERAQDTSGDACGHALMASCPPEPFPELSDEIPFGYAHTHADAHKGDHPPSNQSNQQTWELSKADLATLLNLSKKLDLDGEITPVMAWGMVLSHPKLTDLKREDFERLMDDLKGKVRCYGFGAVMEEFEVRDALNAVFSSKPEMSMAFIMATTSLADLIAALPEGDGWGPPVVTDTTLDGVPYAPFSKGDKLGRMADWTADSKDGRDGRGGRQQYNRNYRDQQIYGAGSAALFTAPVAEDENTFSVVSRETTKTRYGRGAVFTRGRGQRGARQDTRGGRGQAQGRGRGGQQGYGGYDSRGGRSNAPRGRRFGWKDYDKPARNRDASINIKPDWHLLEEIDFNRLAKLNLDADEGEDMDSYGFLYYYDRSYDKQPVKAAEKRLVPLDRAAYNVTTSSDPVIQDLADKDEATIFATDSILSMLMCSTRSVYPWDLVIIKQGNKIFLDKRDNAALDMVTVNENAADAPLESSDGNKDGVNQPGALAEEATYINHNFANQVVLENENQRVEMTHDNPFYNASEETEPPASKAYKYRRFDLSTSDEDPMYLIVRTELDAVQKNVISGDDQFVTVKALNEFDNKAQGSGGALDWRTKLVSQRGAVVATEMKNNSVKLARWTVQAILSKADVMKLGFVSRANPKTNDKHIILGVIGWKPKDFANQMNLSLSNGWGIVRTIADMCLKREDGKFVLVKDPNKSILRLYEVPASSFEEDVEEEEVPETVPEEE
ncbi:eukaryotic translation initiation factor 3 subunit 7-domain-containing protein [Jackrogersella minutella]|nr:eukaryotic translation initiation factor 3 subunit 7-domain-containing protein [Jackrogersella minutella]